MLADSIERRSDCRRRTEKERSGDAVHHNVGIGREIRVVRGATIATRGVGHVLLDHRHGVFDLDRLVGGGVGGVLGATLDESADVKLNRMARPYVQSVSPPPPAEAPRPAPSGAAERGPQWTGDQVHNKLHDVGYQRVYNVRQQGNAYRARGEREGRAYDITVDANTGRIISSTDVGPAPPRPTRSGDTSPGGASEQQVRNTLRQEGYDRIGSMQRSGDTYRTQAMRDNTMYNVTVDARTGRIVSEEPASGQPGGAPTTGGIDDSQVRGTLQREGYDQVSDLRREGGMYIARAQRGGQLYTVRVDAQTGRTVQSEPAQ